MGEVAIASRRDMAKGKIREVHSGSMGRFVTLDDPLYHLTRSHLPRTITRPEVTLFAICELQKELPKLQGKKERKNR